MKLKKYNSIVIQYEKYNAQNRVQCEKTAMHRIQCIVYNTQNTNLRIHGLEYKALNAIHIMQCMKYNAWLEKEHCIVNKPKDNVYHDIDQRSILQRDVIF